VGGRQKAKIKIDRTPNEINLWHNACWRRTKEQKKGKKGVGE